MKKQKMEFKTNYNGIRKKSDFEHCDPISMTIKNDVYSLREIVEKFSREYPKSLQRLGYYDDTEDFDDVDLTRSADFDLVDAYEMRENIKNKVRQKEQNMITFDDTKKQQKSEVKTEKTLQLNPSDV